MKSGAAADAMTRSQNGAGGTRRNGTRLAATMTAMARPLRRSTDRSRKGTVVQGCAGIMILPDGLLDCLKWVTLSEKKASAIISS